MKMKMRMGYFYLSVIVLILSLSGCAQWEAIKTSGRATAQEVADQALKVTLWKLCKGSSIGAINRWIGSNKEMADAYKVLCSRSVQADVINTSE